MLQLLSQYSGLPLERLHNALRLANTKYDRSPEQLRGLLDVLVDKGKLQVYLYLYLCIDIDIDVDVDIRR